MKLSLIQGGLMHSMNSEAVEALADNILNLLFSCNLVFTLTPGHFNVFMKISNHATIQACMLPKNNFNDTV